MKCDRCNTNIETGEEREHCGEMLCEDCYMDALSPVRTCDPWAVHSAKTLEQNVNGGLQLTQIQSEILSVLKEAGGLERAELVSRLHGKLSLKDLEREFAALRHMELARAEKRGDTILLRLW